ncbi:hypothetical protein [Ktedonospora formicarum]|uniref:Uncharacterized protein n=1 Tax=Ktedonospora formicarum TaxID=2778364 RepID=A0A8J3HXK7_9CHLR|nr:hypothetical protein [Ktedonospora formicarum]GHO41839.1 hypothetical protein KSX_00020 [Ktedonospora formicarum]
MNDEEIQGRLRLTDAMNTYNPALTVLKNKGYHLYFVPDERPQCFGDFWAMKDGRVFIAMDPLRLLGLIGVWEGMGDGWSHLRYEDIWGQLTDIGFVEDDFRSWDENAFQQLTRELRLVFDAMGQDLPEPVTRAALAQIIKSWSEGEEITGQDLSGE